MKKESLVHLKALLEADHKVTRVDITRKYENEDWLIIHSEVGDIEVNTEGYSESFVMYMIGREFVERKNYA